MVVHGVRHFMLLCASLLFVCLLGSCFDYEHAPRVLLADATYLTDGTYVYVDDNDCASAGYESITDSSTCEAARSALAAVSTSDTFGGEWASLASSA